MTSRQEIRTAAELFERAALLWPDNDAVIFPDRRRTYAELRGKAHERARGLAALGVGRGDHVGLLMPNCVEFAELVWGVALLGVVLVPLNTRYKACELHYVLENADVSVLVTSDALKPHVDFAALQIASYKIPRYVRFVTEWPMSTTKVRKPDLGKLPLGERLI